MPVQKRARERFQYFVDLGLLEGVPSGWQLAMGSLIMLPALYSESPRERLMSRRTLLGQVPIRAPIQALYCPSQAIASTGLFATRETLIKHVTSVYHEDAALTYDLQLLQSHPGGLDALVREASSIAGGTHRLSWLLTQLVGGPGYHERVVSLCALARRFKYPDGPLDARFSSVIGFGRFCLSLPDWPRRDFYGFDFEALQRDRGAASEDAPR